MSDFKLLFALVAAFGVFAGGWWFGWFGPVSKRFQAINSNIARGPARPATYKNHGWPVAD